jgi:predicted membrane chloride channel (bestrophin family)
MHLSAKQKHLARLETCAYPSNERILRKYMQPDGWPRVSDHPELITPFTITSFALSLLMLFKTNSAYARWWEARTQLGQLYINVRSVLRMVSLGEMFCSTQAPCPLAHSRYPTC